MLPSLPSCALQPAGGALLPSQWYGTRIRVWVEGYVKNVRSLVALQDIVNAHARLIQRLWVIQTTTEPVTYQKHLRFTAMIWLGFLPWTLVPALGLWAIPVSGVIGFVVFKLENVAAILQNPFGLHNSAIPICLQNDVFRRGVRSMLLHYRSLETGRILDVDKEARPPP